MRVTLITPAFRLNNLIKIKKDINFDYVDEWIIVYDKSKINKNPYLFKNTEKIKEHLLDNWTDGSAERTNLFTQADDLALQRGVEKSGVMPWNASRPNAMRNYALNKVIQQWGSEGDSCGFENTYVYFLDDDNIIHPNLYKLLKKTDGGKLYTFNQQCADAVRKGNVLDICRIDAGQILIDYSICSDIRWDENAGAFADGNYIKECYKQNQDSWAYIDDTLCYHNGL